MKLLLIDIGNTNTKIKVTGESEVHSVQTSDKYTKEILSLLLPEQIKVEVDDVVISSKLVDAPVCISTKEGLSLEMEKTLNEQKGQDDEGVKSSKVLELNPDHELFEAFVSIEDNDELVKKFAIVLYNEALLLEGYDNFNKQEFVKKINELMVLALRK